MTFAVEKPDISFIVPCFNHIAQTKKMLETLQATLPKKLNYEIILIDDCSTDDTAEWLRHLRNPAIKTIFNKDNVGFAKANNAGLKIAKGSVIGLLNNDLIFETTWLEPMLAILQSATLNAGIVGNVQLTVADGRLDHAGVYLNPLGQFDHIRVMPHQHVLPYIEALAVTGACCLIKKSILDHLDGLDETFVNGCEDIDLCLSVNNLNLKCYIALNSVIYHHVSLSRDRNSIQNEHNSRELRKKWRSFIKNYVAEIYHGFLQTSNKAAIEEFFDGSLSSRFVQTPILASHLLAENVLKREENRWLISLDQNDHIETARVNISCVGLFSAIEFGHMIPSFATMISLSGFVDIQNFYLVGYSTAPTSDTTLLLTLSVNGFQTATTEVVPGCDFSVGINHPLLLSDVENYFTFHFMAKDSSTLSDTKELVPNVFFTHFIISNRKVALP
jgi:GT2 family glycosyltransferase